MLQEYSKPGMSASQVLVVVVVVHPQASQLYPVSALMVEQSRYSGTASIQEKTWPGIVP